jgi:septal ring factor EnvC (AmiA/AmiB activator)
MKKWKFRAIILLMSLALLGILLIQMYWFNESLQRSREQFKMQIQKVLDNVEKKVEEIQIYNNSLFEEIKNLVIVDNETLSKAADFLKKLKETAKAIDEREKEFTKPLNDTLKKIRDVFRPQKDAIENINIYQISQYYFHYKNGMNINYFYIHQVKMV